MGTPRLPRQDSQSLSLFGAAGPHPPHRSTRRRRIAVSRVGCCMRRCAARRGLHSPSPKSRAPPRRCASVCLSLPRQPRLAGCHQMRSVPPAPADHPHRRQFAPARAVLPRTALASAQPRLARSTQSTRRVQRRIRLAAPWPTPRPQPPLSPPVAKPLSSSLSNHRRLPRQAASSIAGSHSRHQAVAPIAHLATNGAGEAPRSQQRTTRAEHGPLAGLRHPRPSHTRPRSARRI